MKYYYAWLIIGDLLFHAYFIYIGNYTWLYGDLLFGTIYTLHLLWKKRKLSPFFYGNLWVRKYFVTAYGMVLIEETLAAFVNNLNEGFKFYLFLERILQFWAFNLLAFSGLIFGMFVVNRKQLMSKKELIIFASLYGIYAEHQLQNIFASPIIFFVYAPIVIAIYYVIFSPSISFLIEEQPLRKIHKLVRYIISSIILFICTIPFILTLMNLRVHYPNVFPPCSMIQCEQ